MVLLVLFFVVLGLAWLGLVQQREWLIVSWSWSCGLQLNNIVCGKGTRTEEKRDKIVQSMGRGMQQDPGVLHRAERQCTHNKQKQHSRSLVLATTGGLGVLLVVCLCSGTWEGMQIQAKGGRIDTQLAEAGECTNLETRAEPQQIVAQGLLSCLQYPVS